MCIIAANLIYALRRHPNLTLDYQEVEAGWCVTAGGLSETVSATHADPIEATRLALVEVAPE
jgi:hypothetical protein